MGGYEQRDDLSHLKEWGEGMGGEGGGEGKGGRERGREGGREGGGHALIMQFLHISARHTSPPFNLIEKYNKLVADTQLLKYLGFFLKV